MEIMREHTYKKDIGSGLTLSLPKKIRTRFSIIKMISKYNTTYKMNFKLISNIESLQPSFYLGCIKIQVHKYGL